MLDLLYLLRVGEDNEELRHSLRSVAANLPHGRVWLAGHRPSWVDPDAVRFVPVPRHRDKHTSSTANLLAALREPDMPAHVVLMNDDFFVTSPVAGVPMLHRGSVAEVAAGYSPHGTYGRGMRQTAALLARLGHPEAVSYELHVPMVIHGPTMRHLLELHGRGRIRCLHKRTLYGNLAHCGGRRAEDVKVFRDDQEWNPEGPFLSTNDVTFNRGRVGVWLRARFPDPCRYERAKETTMAKKSAAPQPVTYRNTVTGRLVEMPAADPKMDRSRRWERAEAAEDSGGEPPPPPGDKPAGNASAEQWRAYAVAVGMPAQDAATATRDELRDRYA